MYLNDDAGFRTLRALEHARQFNVYIYKTLEPWLQAPLLEIGSGTGNISQHLLANHTAVSLSDPHREYRDFLKNRFQEVESLNEIYDFDLSHAEFARHYPQCLQAFRTVVAVNVLEHIQDDQLAMVNALQLLQPGGTLVILVPAISALYGSLDQSIHHFRRYQMESLHQLADRSQASLMNIQYFNSFGIIGWWWTGKIMRLQQIPIWQIKCFDAMIPMVRWMDRWTKTCTGLSMVGVFIKK